MIKTKGDVVVLLVAITLLIVAGLLGMCGWFFGSEPYQEFTRNVVLSLISLALGIPFGLSLNRIWQSRQDQEKKKQLLSVLRTVFEKNIELLQTSLDVMQQDFLCYPTFPLDLITLEATTKIRYQLIQDVQLAKLIDKAHFEILHANRRIEIQVSANTESIETHDSGQMPRVSNSVIKMTTKLKIRLAQYKETQCLETILNSRIQGQVLCLMPDSIRLIHDFLGTMQLVGGMTPIEDKREPARGGVIADCLRAIEAINLELGEKDQGIC